MSTKLKSHDCIFVPLENVSYSQRRGGEIFNVIYLGAGSFNSSLTGKEKIRHVFALPDKCELFFTYFPHLSLVYKNIVKDLLDQHGIAEETNWSYILIGESDNVYLNCVPSGEYFNIIKEPFSLEVLLMALKAEVKE